MYRNGFLKIFSLFLFSKFCNLRPMRQDSLLTIFSLCLEVYLCSDVRIEPDAICDTCNETNGNKNSFYPYHLYIIIPHATSCGGHNVFDPSVRQSVNQSVSPVFLVSTTPLKPLPF